MEAESEIRFNFTQALRRAEELEEIAERMGRLAHTELQGSFQNLSSAWKGEAAAAYLKKGSQLEEKILNSAKDLKSTASVIRNVAKRIYDAEMCAYRLAKERNYQNS